MRRSRETVHDLFERMEENPSGCWVWAGAKSKGYGTASVKGKQVTVHRAVYEALIGAVPEGMVLDHLCRNKSCCNPEHLEPVTQRVNVLRGTSLAAVNASKVVCVAGHPLEGENLYETPGGARHCRVCRRARKAEYLERRNAQIAN